MDNDVAVLDIKGFHRPRARYGEIPGLHRDGAVGDGIHIADRNTVRCQTAAAGHDAGPVEREFAVPAHRSVQIQPGAIHYMEGRAQLSVVRYTAGSGWHGDLRAAFQRQGGVVCQRQGGIYLIILIVSLARVNALITGVAGNDVAGIRIGYSAAGVEKQRRTRGYVKVGAPNGIVLIQNAGNGPVEHQIQIIVLSEKEGYASGTLFVKVRECVKIEAARLSQQNIVYQKDTGTGDMDISFTGDRAEMIEAGGGDIQPVQPGGYDVDIRAVKIDEADLAAALVIGPAVLLAGVLPSDGDIGGGASIRSSGGIAAGNGICGGEGRGGRTCRRRPSQERSRDEVFL